MRKTLYIIRQGAYTLFSFVYFLVMCVVFTAVGFVLITLGGATDEHKKRFHRILQRHSRFVVSHIPGTRFTFRNDAKESFSTPSVIISNHQSHIDLMAIMMLTPNLVILTKSWVWHNPFYGAIIRYADFLPIGDPDELIVNVKEKVSQGYSVMIFPEGTRSEDCNIRRFYSGAFFIAEQLGLDIVPIFISGFGKVLPKKSWYLHPGQLVVEVLPRIGHESIVAAGGHRGIMKKIHNLYKAKNEEVCHNR